jgi:hypothetical protein
MVCADFLNDVLGAEDAVEADGLACDMIILGFGVEETSNNLEFVEHVFLLLKHPFIKLHSFLRSGLDPILFLNYLSFQVLDTFLYSVKLFFEF